MVLNRRTVERWGRYAGRSAPAPAVLYDADGPRQAYAIVEWLMGLPTEEVTGADNLTQNRQITAPSNEVLPLHATAAVTALLR